MKKAIRSNLFRQFMFGIVATLSFMVIAQTFVAQTQNNGHKSGDAVWAKLENEQFYRFCSFVRLADDSAKFWVNCEGREYEVYRAFVKEATTTQVFNPGDKVMASKDPLSDNSYFLCTVIRFDKNDKYVGTYVLKCEDKEYNVTADRVIVYKENPQNAWWRGLLRIILFIVAFLPLFKCSSWVNNALVERFGSNPGTKSALRVIMGIIGTIYLFVVVVFLRWTEI